jgi:uncharacterized protein (UPF0548 family)
VPASHPDREELLVQHEPRLPAARGSNPGECLVYGVGYAECVPGLPLSRRLATAARWPVGIGLTSWRYMWRTTPFHRDERAGSPSDDVAPPLPAGVSRDEIQGPDDGFGPLFHRSYRMRIREPRMSARQLMAHLQADPDAAAPGEFATFVKVHGAEGSMGVGDEFVVRMAGPWDGPVRVVDVTEASFRLVTLARHLEAGQIEFSAADVEGGVAFCIESWARSADRLADLLYQHLRMAKEVQLHMWTSFLERSAEIAGGRVTGGIRIDTRRVDLAVNRTVTELRDRALNFDPERCYEHVPENGWHVDDLCEPLPSERPGPPVDGGSWEIARRLMRGYEFADPSIVRASYDSDEPLAGRTMLLQLRFHGLRFHGGVRVSEVYDEERQRDGRTARVWGWAYQTLEGHLEMGQMDWQVWKWLDTGQVEFRIHAYSRVAPDRNPIVRLGFRLFGRREQLAFLHSTLERMRRLTETALREGGGEPVRRTADELTARRGWGTGRASSRLATYVEDDEERMPSGQPGDEPVPSRPWSRRRPSG